VSLLTLFEAVLQRFSPGSPNAPANMFIFGFITPNKEAISVRFNRETAQIVAGVRDAEYIVYGTEEVFTAALNPTMPDRAAWVSQLSMKPEYPFNNYLLSIFLNTFDLSIADLDYTPKRFDGPFPFPPRYPVAENPFRFRQNPHVPLPVYDAQSLPDIIVDDHPEWSAMYHKAWQLAFKNLRQPEPTSGFIANFIDPAFNANTFMWDSCFMTMFGRYARRVFPFMGTLDNFYAKQHDDGFICREINTYSGASLFQSLDPRSTGPNILAWTEWLDYQQSGDVSRLQDVFPGLVGYHRWWKGWRTHPDGSYWTSGWGSGMDNQTRIPHSEYHHRHYTWIDAMMQQALNCRTLLNIANVIRRDEFDDELSKEIEYLKHYINTNMWSETSSFYYDRAPDGCLSTTKSIGAFWGLLSDVIPPERAARMMSHLEDERSFNRPHRIPTQAYDSETYNPYGGYWLGGVWSPTNYMTLCGLSRHNNHRLAHEIALNHIQSVARVFRETGTLWENYAPEVIQPGKPAGREFVGWTGVSAINILIEYVIAIQPQPGDINLSWHLHLTERHGVLRYPVGGANRVDLVCEARMTSEDSPIIMITTQQPLTLEVTWGIHTRRLTLDVGGHHIQL
jgi:hypothetical protein